MGMLSHLEANTDLWYAFYLPFFQLSSLFLGIYTKPRKTLRDFSIKIRQLFVPWLFFSLFNILLSQLISFNQHESLLTELKWNFLQIRELGDEIWFVVALFVAFIPFYFFIDWYEGKPSKLIEGRYSRCKTAILIAWALSVISVLYLKLIPEDVLLWNSGALPWHMEYMFQAMFFMVLEYIFRGKFEGWLDEHNTLKS